MADEGLGASLAANLTPEEWQRALLASMQPERSPTRVVVRPDAPAPAVHSAVRQERDCRVTPDKMKGAGTEEKAPKGRDKRF
jgi:hypothetical protein